jgi:GT2 family glycosyltransferase/SAM-dependent methyltransferase
MLTAPTLHEDAAIFARTVDSVPVRMLEVELARPLPALSAFDEKTGQHYQRARCLVRLHDQPLGVVDFALQVYELAAQDYAQRIWRSLDAQIIEHLRQDGLPAVSELSAGGLPGPQYPLCIEEREAFFAAAPFASVIVSTRDRPERLSLCLPALLSQHYPRYEVIIVDNAPATNATADLVKLTYGDRPNLRYVREDGAGLSRGLNRGVMEARGEILAFTDDDVVVDSYWLLQLARAFSLARDVTCVTGLVLPRELETPAQLYFEEYGGFGKGFRRRIYDMAENRPREALFPYTAGRFGTGASMAFRADFLRSVGGFDPALKCGMDIAAFFQAIRQGHKLVYEPAALAYHTHRRTLSELQQQIYNYGVALTAYLSKNILEQPRCLLELITKAPAGLAFIFSPRSSKNRKKSTHYPRELTRFELKGMLHGPFIYVYERWRIPHKSIITAYPESHNALRKQLQEHYEIEKELATRLRESSREERNTLYASLYDEYNRRTAAGTALAQKQPSETSPQWRFLRRFLHRDTVFLEVGAGNCTISLAAARYVKKVFALEVSTEITRHVQGPPNFELVLFDGFDMPLPAESVNVAFSDQVMEHIHPEDALEQLTNIQRVLANSGMYICITPNRLNGPHDISRHFDTVATGFHLREYTNSELSALFKRAGFARVEAYIGVPALYVKCPLVFLRLLEGFLSRLPRKWGLALARISLPWCVRLVGIKEKKDQS